LITQYQIPIYGKLISKNPPVGDYEQPVQPLSLYEIPDRPEEVFTSKIITYDFETDLCVIELDAADEIHTWLNDALAEIPGGKSKIRQYMDDNNLVLVRADLET
jgi:hypothetical protein